MTRSLVAEAQLAAPSFVPPLEGKARHGEIGPDLFSHACLMGLEGLVSKHHESIYRGGRSYCWIKVKNWAHPAFSRVLDEF